MSEVPSIIFDDFTMDSKYVNFPYSVRSSAIKILQNKPNVDIYFCNLILNAIHFPDLGHARHYISYVQNQECNIPSFAEQKRIGDFFRTLDDLIVAAERKVELLKRRKKAYLQRIFNQELRCKGFSESWHWQKASDIFEPVTIKGLPGLPVLSVTQEHGVVHREKLDIDIKYDESSLTTYKKVSPGDFIISLRSFQGGFELSQVEGIVSPAYTVLEFRNPSDSDPSFWRHFFKSYDFIQLLKKVTFGIRDGKSISYEQFASLKLPIPAYAEQIRIGACLNAMDDLISAAEHRIELLQKRKQGYMQRMFA